MNIIEKNLTDIKPYEKNPRKNDNAVEYVANSIKEFGFKVPIVIDNNGVIVAGHTRYKASKKLGLEKVPCIIADDLTPEQIKAYRLADNKVAEKAEWDFGYTDEECGEKLWKPAFQNMRDVAKDHCSIYVTMPQGGAHMMMMMMCAASWQVKHELIWVKNNHVLGRTDYFYKHEPILYGWAKTHKFYGKGEFNKSVWEIPKPQKSDLHPTMKPIRLISNCLQNNTIKNDLVIDLFGGSGSTLIACEQLNRICYMMELDPHYVDVIIARWEQFTGQKAVRLNN